MELAELQKHWNAMGMEDPLWAIMTVPGKRFGQWNVDEFFESGRKLIAGQMRLLDERGYAPKRGRALDFGCGVGRLTQALGDFYAECDGVDISPAMVDRARQFNRHDDRCRYHLNERDDLSLFPDNSFDLVFTSIVLQHMQPKYALRYIAEFLRILAPGGLALFHMPAGHEPAKPGPNRARTMHHEPLPDSAFRAEICTIERPTVLWAGSHVELMARVKNLSDVTWRATGAEQYRLWISLGNHWLNERYEVVVNDDGRAGLQWDIEPGEEGDFLLGVNVPTAPGHYVLELDMVQEYVSWFKQKGSQTFRLPIEVQAPPAERDFTPEIQMYSIPKDEMLAFLGDRGGKLLEAQRVNEGGGLLEYNYYVTKI